MSVAAAAARIVGDRSGVGVESISGTRVQRYNQGVIRRRYDLCRKYREYRKFLIDDGSAGTWPSSPRAEERLLSLQSRFRRHRSAPANAGTSRRINGLQGFPKRRGERNPVCRSVRQTRVKSYALVWAVAPTGPSIEAIRTAICCRAYARGS